MIRINIIQMVSFCCIFASFDLKCASLHLFVNMHTDILFMYPMIKDSIPVPSAGIILAHRHDRPF